MLIVDANVGIKLVAFEPGREEALLRLEGETELVAPDWILLEAGHALWRKVKLGEINRQTAEAGLLGLPSFFESLEQVGPLIGDAQRLAFELDHGVYDCTYLALALERKTLLLTADRKFANAAKRAGYGASVELLTWDETPA